MSDYQREKISERFKLLRQKLKKSQLEIAEDTGVKKSTVSSYELGTRQITPKFIMALEDTYNVNRNWLINGVGEMYTKKSLGVGDSNSDFYDHRTFEQVEELEPDISDDVEMFDILLENMKSIFEKQSQEIKLLRAENNNLQKLVSMFKR
jgi:transcriptional regulator with XRE-family HTH domain